jgi:hypothetical protein
MIYFYRFIHDSVDKAPVEEASTRKILEEEDIDTLRPIYDDTKSSCCSSTTTSLIYSFIFSLREEIGPPY